MSEGYQVKPDVLGEHEDEVRRIADAVDQAVGAAGQSQALGNNAFGLVGQVIALPVQGWISAATDFLHRSADSGHEVADRVRKAHAQHVETEKRHAAALKKIRNGIPR